MKRYFTKKRVLTTIVACLLTVQILFALSPSDVSADSNDRRQALIQMAKSKDFQDIKDLENMTYDDLRVIGVFLSNFYVPWSTAIGVSSAEDDVKKEMVNALVDQCGFNKNVAEALVPMIWDMALSTSQPLEIAKYDPDTGEIIKTFSEDASQPMYLTVGDGDNAYTFEIGEHGGFVATAYSFFYLTSGSMNVERFVNEDIAGKYWCMYWTDGETDKVVWTNEICEYTTETTGSGDTAVTTQTDGQENTFTASTIAYAMIADSLNYNSGFGGNSLLACKDYDFYNSLSDINKNKMFLTQAKLYVTCFGDILCDTGLDQLVVMPACVNPFCWYIFGDDESKGKYVNLVNTFMIGEAETGNITGGENPDYLVYTGSQSLFNVECWRMYRGSSDTSPDNDVSIGSWGNSAESTALIDLVDTVFQKTGDSNDSVGFFNWGTFTESLDESDEKAGYSEIW